MTLASPPRLVVSDMDGTLLDTTGAQVSPRNAEALARASKAGARVVIATGRPVWWLGPVVRAGFTGVAVCMNGAIVYDIADGEILSISPMESLTMHQFVNGLAEHTDDFALAVERVGTRIQDCWAEASYLHPWGEGTFRRTDRASLLSAPALKMLVRGRDDSDSLAASARSAAVEGVAITYSTNDGLLEVAAAGVNKGVAISKLAADWGIDAAEAVAFGDMPNDLEMLQWAGLGVAMDNAHPDVLAVADEVAPHHGDDGVAIVLERWF